MRSYSPLRKVRRLLMRMRLWHAVVSIFVLLATTAYAEMRDPPSIEVLYREATVVLQAEAVRVWPEIAVAWQTRYRVVTFRVLEEYKGKPHTMTTAAIRDEQHEIEHNRGGRFVNVLFLTRRPRGDLLSPQYEVGGKYLLFLGAMAAEAMYGRTEGDASWEERAATPELVKQMETLRAALSKEGK